MICPSFLRRKVRCHIGLWKRLEPVTSVGDPPGSHDDREGRSEGPPEWQHEISQQSEEYKAEPEDFPLHESDCSGRKENFSQIKWPECECGLGGHDLAVP